jgi:ribosomal protein L22
LLDQERRQQAIDEAKLSLTDEQLTKLHAALDYIASMSFQEALQALKDVGVTRMM